MHILLIFPPAQGGVKSLFLQTEGEGIGNKPPLGLLSIAGYVSKFSEHGVSVLDLATRPLDPRKLADAVAKLKPDVVGISTWTDFWFPTVEVMRNVKDCAPQTHIVLGGPHVGIFPRETLEHPLVDSIVLGDGEVPTLSLLNYLSHGKPLSRGVYLKSSPLPEQFDYYVETDLDHLPFPDRTLLPLSDYTSVLSQNKSIATVVSSRGCPYRCVYCKLHFQKTVFRSAQNVVDEFIELAGMGIKEVEIYDDTFTMSFERLRTFCNLMIKHRVPIRWAVRDRVNSVSKESLDLMKRAGCTRIHLGIESGNEKILENIKKKITLDQAEQAVSLAKKAGFVVLAYYMLGLPGETRREVMQTIDFALKLDSRYAEFNVCIPYAGTEMYKSGLEAGIIPFDFWLDYAKHPVREFMVPHLYEEHLSQQEMLALRDYATKRYYARPKVLLREALACRSYAEFMRKAKMGVGMFKSILLSR